MFAGATLLVLLAAQVEPEAALRKRAETLHNDGLAQFDKGQYEAAREAVTESLRLHRQLQDEEPQIYNLRALALIQDGLGDRQLAISNFEQALVLARSRKNQTLEANTLRDLGGVYYNLDVNDRALEYYRRALALQRQFAQPAALATTLFNIGELYRFLGDAAAARPNFDEALGLARTAASRRQEADALSSIAMLELKAGRNAECFRLLREALAIREQMKDPRGEASTRVRLGMAYVASKEVEAARAEFSKSAGLFERIQYRGGEAFARQNIALLEREQGNLSGAAAEMRRAVDLAETLRGRLSDRDLRSVYSGYVQNRYEFLIDVLLRQGDAGAAFEMSERARSRALLETLQAAGVQTSGSGAEPGKPLTLGEIQKEVLDEHTVLLEYALGGDRSFLFVVTADSVAVEELPGREPVEAEARRAYQEFSRPDGNVTDATARLRAMLLRPVLAKYPGKRLLVVADGALQYLPFAALAGPERRVVLAPSASTVALFRRDPRPRAEKGLAVLADPVMSASDPRVRLGVRPGSKVEAGQEFARLAFSRMEADAVLGLAGRNGNLAALGLDATRELVLGGTLSGYRILHFAAHSVVRADQAESSELVLSLVDAAGVPRDGRVRLRDIYGMKIQAELVVLSACQTALGKEMKREGLIGLTRGFQFAGAPRVVASLWKVDDRATAELMKHFYREMLVGGKPASEALAAAQQQVAAQARWKHPFNWAGFVLQGEWR